MDMSIIVNELINRCSAIGAVADSNSRFTDFLYRRLNGRPIGRMEVDELIYEIRTARFEFNKLNSPARSPEERAADWNSKYPIGTRVIRYKLVNPLQYGEETKTRSEAWVASGQAIVKVEGLAGGVLLESLQVL